MSRTPKTPPDAKIKKRVEIFLWEDTSGPLTMGEIMDMAGIDKRMASDVSSALYKLRNQGKVRTIRGPAKSAKGPRFVRLYQWRKQAEAKAPVSVTRVVFDPRATLGVGV